MSKICKITIVLFKFILILFIFYLSYKINNKKPFKKINNKNKYFNKIDYNR